MKLFPVIIGATLLIASCTSTSKEQAIDKSQYEFKVDSLVGERQQEIMTQATEDLDRRISIEVKPKADSIFNVWVAAGKP
jgi:tRNA G18 (ribose-2'-O)-methylase SpoU